MVERQQAAFPAEESSSGELGARGGQLSPNRNAPEQIAP